MAFMNQSMLDIQEDVRRALQEDIGCGDVTAGLLLQDQQAQAKIIAREPLLVCGQAWVNAAFHQLDADIQITWLVEEGSWQAQPCELARLIGKVRPILTGERTALNFLQTLSGTATETYHLTQLLQGYTTRLLDTRKTIPGLRRAQKYAVICGGGFNHRLGLDDAYLIKENHIKASGSVTAAIQAARAANSRLLLEIEVETLAELQEALQAKPDRIMLDNFKLRDIQQAVELAKPYACPLEVSGNVTAQNLRQIAETGVDFISMGGLTKSVKAIDLSLLIEG